MIEMSDKRTKEELTLKGERGLGRRTLLKMAGTAGVGLPLAVYLGDSSCQGIPTARAEVGTRERESYWHPDGYFVQETIDVSDIDRHIIRARIDGEWGEYYNRELPEEFIDWNFGRRLERLHGGMMDGCLDGAHSGCLATYGANRGDSVFTLNAAFKGFGFFPLMDRYREAREEVLDTWDAGMMTKIGVLESFYTDRTMWDFRMMSSLELYSSPYFETHSFLNQMANPVATVNWLDIPGSYEMRSIARLIHPRAPETSDDDYDRVRWVNMMHDYFHGGPYPDPDAPPYIAALYYVVELFDNSPHPGLKGARVTPSL
jgi:hypothetical protein